jgi:hypothetical protein
LAGSAHAAKVARGPKKAANHTHALIDRPRLTAIRPVINIEMNPITRMVAVIMLRFLVTRPSCPLGIRVKK